LIKLGFSYLIAHLNAQLNYLVRVGIAFLFFFLVSNTTLAQLVYPVNHEHTIRCLTPLLIEYEHNPESRARLGPILGVNSINDFYQKQQKEAQITASAEFLSESGRFLLLYETTGSDAVPSTDGNQNSIPDFIEKGAAYADSSWNYLVGQLGFKDPVPDLNNPIKIRFRSFTSRIYGQYLHSTRTIDVHHSFAASYFPSNRDPDGNALGALKATIAHEFKHAIQFATISSPGSNWIEMDATMAEEVVFPTVKDYLNYLGIIRSDGNHYDIFYNPGRPVPFQYYQATFGLFYREKFGDTFWARVWGRAELENNTNLFLMMEKELTAMGESPDLVFIEMYLWHIAAGTIRSVEHFGFTDRRLYPGIFTINTDLERSIPYTSGWRALQPRSANYYEFYPDRTMSSQKIYLGLLRSVGTLRRVSLGVVAWFDDGSIDTAIIYGNDDTKEFSGFTSSRTQLMFGFTGQILPWDTSTITRLAVAVVNPSGTFNIAQSAQVVIGTRDQPSTQRIGFYTQSTVDPSPRTEAEALLDRVVRLETVPQIDNPLGLLATDISASGRATPFDASLILQKEAGLINSYPADPSGDGLIPFPSWYTTYQPIVKATPDQPDMQQVVNVQLNPVFGDPSGQNALDDTLRVHITARSSGTFQSGYFEVDFDSSLFYTQFRSAGSHTNHTVINRYNIIRNENQPNRIHLAIASDQPLIAGDTLVTLHFLPTKDDTVSVVLRRVELDESFTESSYKPSTVFVKKSEGVGIDRPADLPITSVLHSAYPNPFNPTTTIPFELREFSKVNIRVLDLLGRVVTELTNELYSTGTHQVRFNATGLASGIYLIQMTVQGSSTPIGQEQFIQRITLLK